MQSDSVDVFENRFVRCDECTNLSCSVSKNDN
jgi:hypothetical protein